jgi:hypothetical protein
VGRARLPLLMLRRGCDVAWVDALYAVCTKVGGVVLSFDSQSFLGLEIFCRPSTVATTVATGGTDGAVEQMSPFCFTLFSRRFSLQTLSISLTRTLRLERLSSSSTLWLVP